jgi:sugar phosphate isomerase/epimerase
MNRREFLLSAGAAVAASASAPPRTTMGVATTSYMTYGKPKDTLAFLEHCHSLGAGGIQAALSSFEPDAISRVRDTARQYGMYIEVMCALPKTKDTSAFERTAAAAKQVGALCLRGACLSGRRYETFNDLASWQRFVDESNAAIDRALPIVDKHGIPLALENHKDWTVQEMAAMLRARNHPLLGVCLDTGNNISLLDDPMEVVETLAPFALSTHIKDMGMETFGQGFLLSEVVFGEGMLDLKKMIATIRSARPNTRFTLEMITRNPLEVPCLTPKYWKTFPERSGRYLATTLSLVYEQRFRQALPRMDHLSKAAQLKLEDDNVRACLHYARVRLGLA